MSSDNCKKFIQDISVEYQLPLTTKWKRTERFKENNSIIRKFESQQGDEIVIAESASGHFDLLSIEHNINLPLEVKQSMTSINLFTQLYKSYINMLTTSTISEGEKDFSNFEPLSTTSIRKYLLLNDDSFIKQDLVNFKPNPTEDLKIGYKILSLLSYEEDSIHDLYKTNFVNDTSSENVGVIYDKENMYLYYVEKEDVGFFQAVCGGDWEVPVHFLIYWSESEQRLKGFFPKGDANIYNIHYNCAYGSEEEQSREANFPNREAYDKAMNDADTQMVYIDDNFNSLSSIALNKAFKQLKKVILKEALTTKARP